MDLQDFFQNKEFIQVISHELKGGVLSKASFGKKEVYYILRKKRNFRIAEFLPFGLYFPSNIALNGSMITKLIDENNFSQVTFNENPLSKNLDNIKSELINLGFKVFKRQTHILFLDQDLDNIVKTKFNKTRQKHIKRYQKNNLVQVFNTNEPIYYKKYYSIYQNSIKRWGDHNTGYSKTLIENLSLVSNIKLWVAEYQGEMIAGMIVLYSNEGVFDWLAAASINEENKKLYGAVAVQFEVIKHACKNNYKYVNMGASIKLSGVKNFKDSWGAEEITYNSYVYTKKLFGMLKAISNFIR